MGEGWQGGVRTVGAGVLSVSTCQMGEGWQGGVRTVGAGVLSVSTYVSDG